MDQFTTKLIIQPCTLVEHQMNDVRPVYTSITDQTV